jgi:Zn-dependent protease
MKTKELRDLLISTLTLAVAFGIALSGGVPAFSDPNRLLIVCLMSLVSVSLGFILHEMGHRFVARKFGCTAEYRMWPFGLIIALASSLSGFIFAAPGAVMISPGVDSQGRSTLTLEKAGLISIAGPSSSICLAIMFLLLNLAWPTSLFSLGASINAWLAVFNLIPFGPLDGSAVFRWNKMVWLGAAAIAIGLFLFENFV